jgi:glutathione peroxidase
MWIDTAVQGSGKIYKEYKDQNFVIVGFPANFGSKNWEQMKRLLLLPTKLRCNFSHDGQSIRKGVICVNVSILNPKSKNGLEDSDVSWNQKIPNQ